jgi:hypothetical protein
LSAILRYNTGKHSVVVPLGLAWNAIFSYFFRLSACRHDSSSHDIFIFPMTTTFPTGPCCLGDSCFVPQHELRKNCPGCQGLIHLLCGRCLWEDEGEFKADMVICPRCDPKRKGSQAPLRPGQGLKSPRRMQPLNCVPPLQPIEPQPPPKPAPSRNKLRKTNPPQLPTTESNQPQVEEPTTETNQPQLLEEPTKESNQPQVEEPTTETNQPQLLEEPTKESNQPKRKKSVAPKTSCRGKSVGRVKIKIRRRVKIPRSQFYHLLQSDDQRATIPKDVPNKYMFFGTVISRGKGKSSWNVKWDTLPVDNNVISNITRTKLTVVEDGEEEKALPNNMQLDEVELNSDDDAAATTPEKNLPAVAKGDSQFCKQEKKDLRAADHYIMKWGNGAEEVVEWTILKDGELFSLGDDGILFNMPEKVHFNEEITEEDLNDPTSFFFNYIFPDITGEFLFFVH